MARVRANVTQSLCACCDARLAQDCATRLGDKHTQRTQKRHFEANANEGGQLRDTAVLMVTAPHMGAGGWLGGSTGRGG